MPTLSARPDWILGLLATRASQVQDLQTKKNTRVFVSKKLEDCMKSRRARIAVLVAVSFAVLGGCTKHKDAETSSAGVADVVPPTPETPRQRQAPNLTPTSATIGPEGGSLKSADNRLSLSIPAGAFASDTEVSIQPTKGSEDGLGVAYRLMPEGITFPQPVTLVWHLSEEDLAQTNLDNLNVASQIAAGTWTIQEGIQRDEATHTVSVNARHFSLWELAQTLYLAPTSYRLYCGDPLLLMGNLGGQYVTKKGPTQDHSPQPKPGPTNPQSPDSDIMAPPAPSPDSDILAPPDPSDPDIAALAPLPKTGADEKAIFRHAIWRVNGQAGGNFSVGTVKPAWFFEWGDYVAPAQEPSPSRIVTVSIEITLGTHKMIASALVEILPHQNHWIGTSNITQFDGTTVTGNFTFVPVQLGARRGRQMGRQRFEILDGMVYYRGPKTTGSGCPLDIHPTFHRLEPKEGSLYVDAQNPKLYLLSGGGQAVWSAIYETSCPNGTQYLQSSVSAAWWPSDPYQMSGGAPNMTPVDITPGQLTRVVIHVDSPFGKGIVTLRRDSELQQPGAPN